MTLLLTQYEPFQKCPRRFAVQPARELVQDIRHLVTLVALLPGLRRGAAHPAQKRRAPSPAASTGALRELPQLFNVLQGTMALVGPRPHAVEHNEQYSALIAGYFARHRVKPGITGWAQVNGLRGEIDTPGKMEARVKHDVHYIENWSLLLDLKILAMTPYALLANKNVY